MSVELLCVYEWDPSGARDASARQQPVLGGDADGALRRAKLSAACARSPRRSLPWFSYPVLPAELRPVGGLEVPVDKPGVETLRSVGTAHGVRFDEVGFVFYRNSLRRIVEAVARPPRPGWACDLQLVGRTIYVRRRLNYSTQDYGDVGHLFEQLCTATETGGGRGGSPAEAARPSLRSLARVRVGQHCLLVSGEVDAVEADARTPAPGALPVLMELKTASPRRLGDPVFRRLVWIQCAVAGVRRAVLAAKEPGRDPRAVRISAVEIVEVESLVDGHFKRWSSEWLATALDWLRRHVVDEGVVYRLAHDAEKPQRLRLARVSGGAEVNPVAVRELLDAADACAPDTR